MEINENTFIEILGLPEWDERVLEVLDALELERPMVEEGEVYAYLSSKKYGIDLVFDYTCITPEQKAMEKNSNLYLNQISFKEDTSLLLPFNIAMHDNYNKVITKIGREPDAKSLGSDTSFRWIISKNKKNCRLVCDFKDEKLESLKKCFIKTEA